MHRLVSIAVSAALLLLAQIAPAAILASWDHTGQPGNQAFTPGVGSPNVTAADLVRGAGLNAASAANSISSNGWNGTDAGDYFELGFSVDAGYQVALDSLLVGTRSSATGPGTIGVYTSIDAFAAPIATIVQPDSIFVNSVIDLSALPLLTGSFALRFLEIGDTQADGAGATASTGTFRIGDFLDGGSFLDTQITGDTSAIPEPGTALLLLGGLAALARGGRRRRTALAALLASIGVGSGSPAQALVVSATPDADPVSIGASVSVSVSASDLAADALGGYDLTLAYDPAILQFTGASFAAPGGLDLGLTGSFQEAIELVPGTVSMLEISFEDVADLVALQPDAFELLTLSFQAIGLGTSALDLEGPPEGVAFSDADGLPLAGTILDSSLTVVPEPGTALLLLLGIGAMARVRRRAAVAAALVAVAMAAPRAAEAVVINEALVSHTGTDNTEFVELYGTPGESLAGLSLIAVESDAAPANLGGIDRRIDFTGADAIGANGFFLVGNPAGLAANYGVTPDRAIGQDSFENSSLTLALVQTSSIIGPTVSGGEIVVDTVGITDGAVGDTFFFGAPVVGPDGTFFPAGVRRVADGVDTNTAADFVLAIFNLGPGNTPTAGSGVVPPVVRTIPQIQGAGATSPDEGLRVETSGVVVADFQGASRLNGFFLQDVTGDGNAVTSDGIFVFAPGAIDVSVGQLVTVVGTVRETLRQTRIQDVTSVVVTGSAPVPSATPVSLPEATQGALEGLEGMLVEITSPMTVSQAFFLGRYGQLTLSGPSDDSVPGRLFQPTQLFRPLTPDAIALADENQRRLLVLDDGQDANPLGDNPNPVPYLGAPPPAVLRAGDTVSGLVGALDQGRINSDQTNPGIDYRLQPTSTPVFATGNPRPAQAPNVGTGRLRVAAFNVLNYFSTIDAGPDVCGPSANLDCRGADSNAEFTRQRDKIIGAIHALGADVVGLIEIENNASAAQQDLVNGLNALPGNAGVWAFVNTGTIGSDAIKVAFIYKQTRVAPEGPFRTLTNAVDPRAIDTKNRPALAQTFRESASGERFTAVVNHWKSKGSDCNVASAPGELVDPDTGDGQGNCNLTRLSKANALRDWLATDPTGSGDPDFLVMGDLNSYGEEDPVVALTGAGWIDVAVRTDGPSIKSYTFDGLAGALDHMLATPSLDTQIVAARHWAINDDEPAVLDYNTEFNPPGYYAADVYRSSDHDPLLASLTLCVDQSDLTALRNALRSNPTDPRYDLDGDGRVTVADARRLVLLFTNPGGAACP